MSEKYNGLSNAEWLRAQYGAEHEEGVVSDKRFTIDDIERVLRDTLDSFGQPEGTCFTKELMDDILRRLRNAEALLSAAKDTVTYRDKRDDLEEAIAEYEAQ